MRTDPTTDRVVITGTGLVCPAADSAAALVKLPRTGPDADDPEQRWFDPVPYLGPRGWKYFSPATRYLLSAATLALADADFDPARHPAESMGVVVGTNFAANPVLARFDETVISDNATALSPAEAPNFSVNLPASQISMRYAMRGFNLSLTNPVVAGVEALLTMRRAIRSGRAQAGLAGATEERPETPTSYPTASEGACCFLLEPLSGAVTRGATVHAGVAGGFSRFLPVAALRDPVGREAVWESAVGRPLTALLEAEGDSLPFVVLTEPDELTGPLADYCATTADRIGVRLHHTGYHGERGDHFTVSAMLQVAGVLAEHGRGLVICASQHGHVAAVRLEHIDGNGH